MPKLMRKGGAMMGVKTRIGTLAVAGVVATSMALSTPASAAAPVKRYAVPKGTAYRTKALWSVGQRVPQWGHPGGRYQMVGIPDGLGAQSHGDSVRVYMNHEFTQDVESEPIIGEPLNRGAFVSKLKLNGSSEVTAADRAYDTVYQENTLVGPAAQIDNSTPAFARLCSGYLALPFNTGFDQPIYFTNEESTGEETFDGRGGQSVAVFDNEAHTLPKLGHFSKENTLVMPHTGRSTVILSLEDGPSSPDSQLYLYIGQKEEGAESVLSRNGLDNGNLYVFASTTPDMNDESTFLEGAIEGGWIEIPGAETMNDEELEVASDAAGAFGFVRIEDGSFSKTNSRDFFFATTGGNADYGNSLGRLYHLRFDGSNPLEAASLEIVYNADPIVHAGGDVAIAPDNLDVSKRYLMIQEDGTDFGRLVLGALGRDGSIWRFKLRPGPRPVVASSARRVVRLNPPGRDGTLVLPGVWESSGIIDSSGPLSAGSWLFDVQAHSPTEAPGLNTEEDGQLLIMTPR